MGATETPSEWQAQDKFFYKKHRECVSVGLPWIKCGKTYSKRVQNGLHILFFDFILNPKAEQKYDTNKNTKKSPENVYTIENKIENVLE